MRWFCLLSFLLLTFVSGASAETQFTVIDDPNAPVGFTQPLGINEAGDIVGTYRAGTTPADPLHGFLLRGGSYTTIDEPNARGVTVAMGINTQGDVVGLFSDGGVLGSHGFLLHQGTYTTIDAPGGGGFTAAVGINAQGVIVGRYQDAPGGALHGFSLIEGHFNKIDAPQASGLTNVFGINDRGDVVGAYSDAPTLMHGFVLHSSGGSFETIDVPKAAGLTVATGINNRNDVVGYYQDRAGATHGFLLRNGHYATIDGPNGVGTTQAFGINSGGDIVGTYSPPKEGFLLRGVPASPDPDAYQSAVGACTDLKANLGSNVFAEAYRTLGRCVFNRVPIEQLNIEGSRSGCTAEQNDVGFAARHGGRTFEQFYGTVLIAFDNCVIIELVATSQAEQQGRASPSRTCRSLWTQVGARAFSLLYGRHDAFVRCVSETATTQTQNELGAAESCRSQQNDVGFTDTHGGKTFAQVFGTDANLSNAFGKCTAARASATAASQQRATVAATRKCEREQKADTTAFKSKYRSFGRCVSRYAGRK
jgi:hypothetical protein